MGKIKVLQCRNVLFNFLHPNKFEFQTMEKYFSDLERLLVDINIISDLCSLGLAEENEIFKEEDAADAFLLSKENRELVLANQLALFF